MIVLGAYLKIKPLASDFSFDLKKYKGAEVVDMR